MWEVIFLLLIQSFMFFWMYCVLSVLVGPMVIFIQFYEPTRDERVMTNIRP